MPWTAPPTFTAGQVIAVSDMNTYVRDNENYLYGDSARVPLTLSSGWGIAGGWPTPFVRRFGAMVYCLAVLQNNTGATQGNGAVVATIPAGYAPPYQVPITMIAYTGTSIISSGSGYNNGVNANITINVGISLPATDFLYCYGVWTLI